MLHMVVYVERILRSNQVFSHFLAETQCYNSITMYSLSLCLVFRFFFCFGQYLDFTVILNQVSAGSKTVLAIGPGMLLLSLSWFFLVGCSCLILVFLLSRTKSDRRFSDGKAMPTLKVYL